MQNATGVDGILAGGAPVNEARRVLVPVRDKFGEFLDEGDGQISGESGVFGDGGEVEIFRAALTGDDLCLGLRDDSGGGLGAGKSGFKIEHALNAGFVGEEFIQRGVAK